MVNRLINHKNVVYTHKKFYYCTENKAVFCDFCRNMDVIRKYYIEPRKKNSIYDLSYANPSFKLFNLYFQAGMGIQRGQENHEEKVKRP